MRGLHERDSNIVPEIARAAKLLEEIEMNGDGEAKQIVDGGCVKGDGGIVAKTFPGTGDFSQSREVGPNASKISRPRFPIDYEDIHNEAWREYTYEGGAKVRIENPTHLYVSSNGHRVADREGHGHYVPKGWIHLEWAPAPGLSHCMEF